MGDAWLFAKWREQHVPTPGFKRKMIARLRTCYRRQRPTLRVAWCDWSAHRVIYVCTNAPPRVP